jgi:hypothetical protein
MEQTKSRKKILWRKMKILGGFGFATVNLMTVAKST